MDKNETDKKPPGRPRLYESPEEFDAMVELYKAEIKESKTPATWTGLALFLGFSSRQSIDEYQKYTGFSDSVKRAKLFIESEYEKRLFSVSPTGAIFGLKNYGWSDKQELEHSGKDGGPIQATLLFNPVGKDHASDPD